ncbi:P-loop NTPase [Halomicrococcus sp. NG-SE-24]|uniref:nucleotide-binding protein n=1 Tax=Halomicrococcus sp. NG-SE-24 TaxID=3436928 RepID=UPI003D99FB95
MLAVAGGKGRCGKTTTTLGLGAALGRTGRETLAVDADRDMPDLHVVADVPAEPNLAALADGKPVESAAHPPPALRGVEVVPAPPATGMDASLSTALPRVADAADRVLLDCPAGAGPAAAVPFRHADSVLVVTTPVPACLRDAAKTAAMARALDTDVAGAVLTRAERDPGGVERLLDCPVLATVPDVDANAPTAAGDRRDSGRRVLAADAVERAYDRLAATVVSKHL